MTDDDQHPQIYLITPAQCDLGFYSDTFAALLDAHPVACVRLGLRSDDLRALSKHADYLHEQAHQRDIPILITDHYKLVPELGLDGVHRSDGTKQLRDIRKYLGSDAIIGAYCANSKHAGMTAGEIGADYISFGPMQPDPLHDAQPADRDLFAWWSQMVELPVLAEGQLTPELARGIAPVCDFIALGSELWQSSDPADVVLGEYIKAI